MQLRQHEGRLPQYTFTILAYSTSSIVVSKVCFDCNHLLNHVSSGLCSFQQDRHIIIPLHSTIAPEDQKRAFVRPPVGVRKIVVSTNIAETSVTIEDVVYVVDSGKLKERRFNAARGISMLVLDHVSQVIYLQHEIL